MHSIAPEASQVLKTHYSHLTQTIIRRCISTHPQLATRYRSLTLDYDRSAANQLVYDDCN